MRIVGSVMVFHAVAVFRAVGAFRIEAYLYVYSHVVDESYVFCGSRVGHLGGHALFFRCFYYLRRDVVCFEVRAFSRVVS